MASPSRSSISAFLRRFSNASRDSGFQSSAGIWPLTSLRNAEFMKNDLRVSVPDEILLRMQRAANPEASARGRNFHRPGMLAAARSMVQGVQVSAPFGRYSAAAEVLREVIATAPFG